MAEFSTSTRLLATLLLIVLSLVAWRWFGASTAASTTASLSTTTDKKKPKKKSKKKKKTESTATHDADDRTPLTAVESAAVSSAPASDSDEDTDQDAGLSAKQILAKRRFKPKAIGGGTAVTAIPTVVRFEVNQRIVARYQDGKDWFPGVITEVRRGMEYHIQYDDGAVEFHVPHARIKDAAAEATSDRPAKSVKRSELDPSVSGVALDSGRSEADDEAEASGSGEVDSDSDGDGDDDQDDGDSEDGWQVVASTAKKTRKPAVATTEAEKVDAEGLTKRQRENRRKKERKKEMKELVRSQAQEQGLHARWGGTMTRLKYVPPPPQQSSTS